MNESERRYHEVANIFPMMSTAEYESLKSDISENGLLEPVWLHPGDHSIIDGRNRHKACVDLGKEPKFRYWDGKSDLVSFVVSLNLKRRHLNESQRGMVAARIANMREGRPNKTSPIGEVSQANAAEMLNVGKRTVERSKAVQSNGTPELVAAVDEGRISVSTAATIAQAPAPEQVVIVAQGPKEVVKRAKEIRQKKRQENILSKKTEAQNLPSLDGQKVYNVIYADPPWEYSNSGVHGAAFHHYNTMPTSKIKTLLEDIDLKVADNAVLFLWITNPLMAEAFDVIESWGFTYKTNMVWVKTELKKPGSGFYVRGRHELLFIATRGSFTPLDDRISPPIGSVVQHSIMEHSRKPECFYEIIERLYPGCNYMELFARSGRDEWEAWGNETDKF